MRVAFISGKGGVGKSSLCYGVALALAQAGKSVAVEDRDPQQSITGWIQHERDGILENASEAEVVLVDTPPNLEAETVREAIATADRIAVPLTPSPADIGAGKATVAVVREFMGEGGLAVAVVNQVRKGTALSEAVPDIVALLGLPVLATHVPARQSIQRAVLSGWKGLDTPSREAFLRLALELLA